MRTNFAAILLTILALAGCRDATAPASPVGPAQGETIAAAKPALWLVSDSDTQIYLFGTVHALPPDLKWRNDGLDQALAKSRTLVVELVGGGDPAQSVLAFNRMGHAKGLPPIENRVPPALRPRLSEAAKTAGVSLSTLNGYESWAAALVLSNARTQKAGYQRTAGVEPALVQQFRTSKRPVEGLETMVQQYGFFDSIPESEQRTMLANALSPSGSSEGQMDSAVNAWASGQPEKIASVMNSEADAMPTLKRLLLTDRNGRWADWIRQALNRPGTLFVAVGAGHLAGPGSVQEMLASKGVQVMRVQ